jgi:tRNA threonylcarbamoyladenosine biosynthesis protein TsaE
VDPSPAAVERGITRRTHDVSETRALGRALGRMAAAGTVLALTGPLGAGKTQLAKGVAQGLEVETVVNSPTFVLMNEHEGRLRLFHIDAYRLDDPEEALAAGLLDERQAAGVTVIEWADRLAGWLPAERLDITISAVPGDDRARLLELVPRGAPHAQLAARLQSAAP